MKKKVLENRIMDWAYEYARSGEFEEYGAIERRLRSDGYPQARTVLDNFQTRKELNELCEQAQKNKK